MTSKMSAFCARCRRVRMSAVEFTNSCTKGLRIIFLHFCVYVHQVHVTSGFLVTFTATESECCIMWQINKKHEHQAHSNLTLMPQLWHLWSIAFGLWYFKISCSLRTRKVCFNGALLILHWRKWNSILLKKSNHLEKSYALRYCKTLIKISKP